MNLIVVYYVLFVYISNLGDPINFCKLSVTDLISNSNLIESVPMLKVGCFISVNVISTHNVFK